MAHTAPEMNYTILARHNPATQEIRKSVEEDEAFWVADLNVPRNCLALWEEHLPSVKMYYAMKCCDEPHLLRFLADRGTGFDCASKNEIERILGLHVSGSRIVFSHPLKSIESLRYAKEYGVEKLVFDSEMELQKIMRYYPSAQVYLRVKPRFSNAKIQLSEKFGAAPNDVSSLLSLARELGANFIGFSFHVGSLCDDVESLAGAVQYVSELRAKALALGLKVDFIDIGGGFYSPNSPAKLGFPGIAAGIERAIREGFADGGIEIIGEPGRFIAAEYLELNLPVIGIKRVEGIGGAIVQHVYLPDGIYGAFNCIAYDHAEPHFEIVTNARKDDVVETNLWGQTCDSMDVIYAKMQWPVLKIGDFVTVRKFGAYTYSPSSFFNGFLHHKVFPINKEDNNENLL
jgi:ornithine decarboxylase